MTVEIDSSVTLPDDSSAQILSEGLAGEKYVALAAGTPEKMFAPGVEIEHTQGSVDLINLVGRAIFCKTRQEKGGAK